MQALCQLVRGRLLPALRMFFRENSVSLVISWPQWTGAWSSGSGVMKSPGRLKMDPFAAVYGGRVLRLGAYQFCFARYPRKSLHQ